MARTITKVTRTRRENATGTPEMVLASHEVIKPKQLSKFVPVIPGNGSKQDVKAKLVAMGCSYIRYSGNEKGFYHN